MSKYFIYIMTSIINYYIGMRQHCQLLIYNLYIELSKKIIKIKVIMLLLIIKYIMLFYNYNTYV